MRTNTYYDIIVSYERTFESKVRSKYKRYLPSYYLRFISCNTILVFYLILLANDGRGLMRQPRQPGFVAGANCVLLSLARDTHRSSGAMVRISVLNDTLKVRALRCTSKTHFTRCYLRLSIARRFRQYGNLHFFRVFLLILGRLSSCRPCTTPKSAESAKFWFAPCLKWLLSSSRSCRSTVSAPLNCFLHVRFPPSFRAVDKPIFERPL